MVPTSTSPCAWNLYSVIISTYPVLALQLLFLIPAHGLVGQQGNSIVGVDEVPKEHSQ